MSEKVPGKAELKPEDGKATLTLGGDGTLGDDAAGRISLRDSLGRQTVHLDGETGYAELKGLAGHVNIGGHGEDGQLFVNNRDGEATIYLEADANLGLGGHGHYGSLYLRDKHGDKRVALYGHAGELVLFSGPRKESIRLSGKTGNIHLGGGGQDGDVFVHNKSGETTVHLDGEAGVIDLPNADCAEDFAVAECADLTAGDVVVFDQEAALQRCDRAYDKRVAGVISGAGDTRPGIVLGRDRRRGNRLPVALIGKVHCKVDARYGAIDLGDLLTTSPHPGHAMKAGDPHRAFGTVLGKALRPLAAGRGLIPVLVTLG